MCESARVSYTGLPYRSKGKFVIQVYGRISISGSLVAYVQSWLTSPAPTPPDEKASNPYIATNRDEGGVAAV